MADLNKENEKKATLEENLAELETVITELEKDDVPLEQAFSLYEKGVKLAKLCEEDIDTVEKKVLLLSKGETGEFQ